MEFHEKIQQLRKQKGLTQDEVAAALYVSRTAVSKWESGRGYPGIDSLKALAQFYGVTVDALLSGEELLTAAREDQRQRMTHLRDTVFALLDCSVLLCLFLPLFRQTAADGITQAVSLLALTEPAVYLRLAYFIFVIVVPLLGLLTLLLPGCQSSFSSDSRQHISCLLTVCGVLLFIISTQPYAAALLFVFVLIKGFLLIKRI